MRKLTKTALSSVFMWGLVICGISTTSASGRTEENVFGRVDKQFSVSDDSSISIDLSSTTVNVEVSPDDKVHITYYNTDHFKYEIEQNGDKLKFKQLGLNFPVKFEQAEDATVLIPKQFNGTLSVYTSSGNINTDAVSANTIGLKASSGNIEAKKLSSTEDMSITASSGDINLRNVKSTDGTLTIYTSSGNKILNTISANSIHIESSSGWDNFEQIVCTDIIIKSTSGDIEFSELSAQSIKIASSSGDVRGSLVGNSNDFAVTSSTSSGNNNLPDEWGSGNKTLDVSTTSGNIDISFTE